MKLNKTKLKKFKAIFLERETDLLRSQGSSVEIDAGGDEVDLIQGNQLKSIADKLSSRDKDSLAKIRQALYRIEDGTFGICEECEEQIPEKRLLAIPEANLCVDCAEFQEKHLKRIGVSS